METIFFTIADLENLENHNWFRSSKNLPITLHRAVSQAKNPRADKDDLALIVAVDKQEVICYIGMIPDNIFIKEQKIKIAWGSTGWVHEDYKNTGIYVVLLFHALEFYDNNFAIAEVSDSAKRVFESSKKFLTLKVLTSTTIVSRFCTEQYFITQNLHYRKIFPLLRFVDFLGNLIVNPMFHLKVKKYRDTLRLKEISETDNEAQNFIEKHSSGNLVMRSKLEIDWILKYPWVLEAKSKSKKNRKYFFSSTTKKFRLGLYKLYENDVLTAVLLIKQRENHLTLPYFWFGVENAEKIVKALYYYSYRLGVAKITLFGENLELSMKSAKTSKLFVKQRVRKSYITKKFSGYDFSEISLQPGDGDNVFT